MFTFGFYDSYNGDRKYNSLEMSSIFDGIITDGIFANIGEAFSVIPGTGMQVIVKTGRAWFNHTWNFNDSWMALNLDPSDVLRSRIDSVVIEINSNTLVRENSIKIIKGALGSSPVAPEMIHADGVDQYRLADITIEPGATNITEINIDLKIGRNETPFITAPLKSIEISDIFQKWNGEFQEWFANIQAQLEGDVATNLQKQIDERVKIADKATATDVEAGTPDKWIDSKFAKDNIIGLTAGLKIGDIVYSTRDLEKETNGQMIRCDQRAITENEYPELYNLPSIKWRRELATSMRIASDAPSVVSPLNSIICGGIVHKHKYCSISISGSSSSAQITVKLYTIDKTSTDFSITFPETYNSVDRYIASYMNDDYIVITLLGSNSKSIWYVVDINAGSYIKYTDGVSSSDYIRIVGYHILKNGKLCLVGYSTNGNVITSTNNYKHMIVRSDNRSHNDSIKNIVFYIYDLDFKTREYFELDTTNYFKEYAESGNILYSLDFNNRIINPYTLELLLVQDDKVLIPFYSNNGSDLELLYIDINQKTIYTRTSNLSSNIDPFSNNLSVIRMFFTNSGNLLCCAAFNMSSIYRSMLILLDNDGMFIKSKEINIADGRNILNNGNITFYNKDYITLADSTDMYVTIFMSDNLDYRLNRSMSSYGISISTGFAYTNIDVSYIGSTNTFYVGTNTPTTVANPYSREIPTFGRNRISMASGTVILFPYRFLITGPESDFIPTFLDIAPDSTKDGATSTGSICIALDDPNTDYIYICAFSADTTYSLAGTLNSIAVFDKKDVKRYIPYLNNAYIKALE